MPAYSLHERVSDLPNGRVRWEVHALWNATAAPLSPFPHEIRQLLLRQSSAKKVHWSALREATPQHMGEHYGPSGVYIEIVADDPESVLHILQRDGILVAPLLSYKEPRLYRHWYQENDTFFLYLPHEIAPWAADALHRFAQWSPCGVMEWGHHTSKPSQLWMSMSRSSEGLLELQQGYEVAFQEDWKPCLLATSSERVQVKQASEPVWRVYYHTLHHTLQTKVVCDEPCHVRVRHALPPILDPQWSKLRIQGSLHWSDLESHSVRRRENGWVWEWSHTLPAESTLWIHLDYEPAWMSLDHLPGDANRGYELPPLVAHFNHTQTLYSASPLLLTPLPDRSMPFNVLSLTCTLYAFVVGGILNLLVHRASKRVHAKLGLVVEPKSKLARLLDRVKAKIKKSKVVTETTSTVKEEEEEEEANKDKPE